MGTTVDTAALRGTPRRTPARRRTSASVSARRRMLRPGERPVFVADWTEVLFVHFAVDPEALQPHVPFPLDLFRGRAYVSVVAFTQRRLRPRIGNRLAGRLAALASRPLSDHEFLNVRTYVRHGGERGICFLTEWIPNRLACLIGPPLYGLPYRLARHKFLFRGEATGRRARHGGEVTTPAGRLAWRARLRPMRTARRARRGLEHFLLERYTAFTRRGDAPLRFRVWHAPWHRVRAAVRPTDTSLLIAAFPWLRAGRPVLAHFSPGVHEVWIGPPRRVEASERRPPAPGNPGEGRGEGSALITWAPAASLLAAALSLHGSTLDSALPRSPSLSARRGRFFSRRPAHSNSCSLTWCLPDGSSTRWAPRASSSIDAHEPRRVVHSRFRSILSHRCFSYWPPPRLC